MSSVLDYKPGISQEEMYDYARRLSVEDIIEREKAAGQVFGPFHQQWQLERAPEHVKRMLELAKVKPELLMANQGFTSPGAAKSNPSAFAAIATTVTESCLWSSPLTTALQLQYAPIPAGDMKAGKKYRVGFGGIISTTLTPTVIWTPRVGPNTTAANAANLSFGASPTVTTVTGLANHAFYGEFAFQVRSLGLAAAGTTATGTGYVMWGNAGAAASVAVMGGTDPTTIDDTITTGILVNLTWGTSSASNTLTCKFVDFNDEN